MRGRYSLGGVGFLLPKGGRAVTWGEAVAREGASFPRREGVVAGEALASLGGRVVAGEVLASLGGRVVARDVLASLGGGYLPGKE